MSENIAKIALTIIKQREDERTSAIQNEFLKRLHDILVEKEQELCLWESIISTDGVDPDEFCIMDKRNCNFAYGITISDIEASCATLGFVIAPSNETFCFRVAIHEWIKGQKKNTAQRIIYNFNNKVNEKREIAKSEADKEANRIAEKIMAGKFSSRKLSEREYQIEVVLEDEISSLGYRKAKLCQKRVFADKIKEFLEKNECHNIEFKILGNSAKCTFTVSNT